MSLRPRRFHGPLRWTALLRLCGGRAGGLHPPAPPRGSTSSEPPSHGHRDTSGTLGTELALRRGPGQCDLGRASWGSLGLRTGGWPQNLRVRVLGQAGDTWVIGPPVRYCPALPLAPHPPTDTPVKALLQRPPGRQPPRPVLSLGPLSAEEAVPTVGGDSSQCPETQVRAPV